MPYDADAISAFYDDYGDKEWERFDATAQDHINLCVHLHYLREFILAGMHVLDAGAGPGRFTIELARLGARVTVVDISAQMLEQNRTRVRAANAESAVVERIQGDISALTGLESGSFDAVVCYGGPLSYVMERADDALSELLRVARPNAPLLLSVMSTIGTARSVLPGVLELASHFGAPAVTNVFENGLLEPPLIRRGHVMKMYRWQELSELLSQHACRLELASASNYLTVGHRETVEELLHQGVDIDDLLSWELRCCREPGALDGGTHMLAVVRKVGGAANREAVHSRLG